MLKNRPRRRLKRSQRGAAAVEFALVLPLLVMFFMGTVTGGMAFYEKISMADAVREGARFAATADSTTGTYVDAVKARTASASSGVLQAAQVCVTPPSRVEGCAEPVSATAPTGPCVVRVFASKPVTFSIVLASWDITLRQDAYARYERTC